MMEINIFKKIVRKIRGQGLVEFAMVIPILLVLMFGIIEAGRLLFIYSAVLSSSREAARYGSAAGEMNGITPYYADCDGIKSAAMRIGRFAGVSATDVSISYDHGPSSSTNFAICPITSDDHISLGDRITVQVVSTFRPLVPLVNFRPVPISAVTSRTIIKDVEIEGTPPSPVIPTISFVTSEETVDEGVGTISVKLVLTAAIAQNVSVPYTLDGTAISGGDYVATPNPVVLLPGDTTANITVTILDDDIDEDDETAVFLMGNPTNAIKGSPSSHIVNIKDNDDPPLVSFVIPDQAFSEDVDNLVMLQLSNPSSKDIVVTYDTSGDAQRGIDYTLPDSPITIPALDTSFPLVLDVIDDLIDEEDEPFSITLLSAVNGVIGSPSVHIYTILDNDLPPEVFFTWDKQSGDESVGTMTVELQLSIESSKDISVQFKLGGSATRDLDYTIDTTPITFLPGEVSASIQINILPDSDDLEGDETIELDMINPSNVTIGSPSKHIATISSTATEPFVHFASASQNANDAVDDRLEVVVLLSSAWSADVTVPLYFDGTATQNQDYSVNAESIVIPAGGASGSIFVKIIDDSIDEFDETINISIGTPTNAKLGNPSLHTITIPDNDPEPLLYLTSSGSTVDEDAGQVTITAQLSVISGKDVTVPFLVLGSAVAGSGNDYTITASPLVIPANSPSVDIVIDVLEDDVIELDEDVIVTLDTPTNAVLSSPGTYTLVIKDNEPNCPAPLNLPFFGSNATAKVLTWPLKSPNPIVPTSLVEVTIHWPEGAGANITGIAFGSSIFTGNALPPTVTVNTPNPLWSGAFDTRDMSIVFSSVPKPVPGDFYQIVATFEGCAPISGILSSE